MIKAGKYKNFEVKTNKNKIIIDCYGDCVSSEAKWDLSIWGVFYEGRHAVMAVNDEYERFVIGTEDNGILYFDLSNAINAYWTPNLIIALTKLMAYNNR